MRLQDTAVEIYSDLTLNPPLAAKKFRRPSTLRRALTIKGDETEGIEEILKIIIL